jgi:hypothetical protein
VIVTMIVSRDSAYIVRGKKASNRARIVSLVRP